MSATRLKLTPGTTILVVDDTPEIMSLAHGILTCSLGATVVCAENGQIAKEKILEQQSPFDLIFTDLEMPVINGRQLAEWLRVTEPKTPIMMWTGSRATIAPEDHPDVDVLLSKPAPLNVVIGSIQALIPHCFQKEALTEPAII